MSATPQHRVLVLGGGKIGSLIAALLAESGSYHVDLADLSPTAAADIAAAHPRAALRPHVLDAANPEALDSHLRAHPVSAVLCALPFRCNRVVAQVCRRREVHYFDLTEDVETTRHVLEIAAGAPTAFVPQCGLAPGMISIVAADLLSRFDEVHDVKLRVGALPQHPSNALKYALTWSTDGLINEYGNTCYGLVAGKITPFAPLEGLETLQLDGQLYEAFHTSGGIGTLAETHAGRVRSMSYKTLRYPGHCAQIQLLMNDLRLNEDRDTLKRILERAVPRTEQDVVLFYVSVTGTKRGQLTEETFARKLYPRRVAGHPRTAIQLTTAAGITAALDLVLSSPGRFRGFVRQEQLRLPDVLENRFGSLYSQSASTRSSPIRAGLHGAIEPLRLVTDLLEAVQDP
ncbi:MAG: saccharopine dehydrogenase C-terminal domain-containing protein [Polyangiaceae bacterium]